MKLFFDIQYWLDPTWYICIFVCWVKKTNKLWEMFSDIITRKQTPIKCKIPLINFPLSKFEHSGFSSINEWPPLVTRNGVQRLLQIFAFCFLYRHHFGITFQRADNTNRRIVLFAGQTIWQLCAWSRAIVGLPVNV